MRFRSRTVAAGKDKMTRTRRFTGKQSLEQGAEFLQDFAHDGDRRGGHALHPSRSPIEAADLVGEHDSLNQAIWG